MTERNAREAREEQEAARLEKVEAAAPKKGPGRHAKPPRDNPRRIAVTVDDDTYGRVLHACADLRIDRQTFLERAIALMFADIQKPK